MKRVAALAIQNEKEAAEKKVKEYAAAPKAETAEGAKKLVVALAVDGVENGSSRYVKSEAELWTENMPKHVQDYNGGVGSTLYSNAKFSKPWGADIE